MGIEEVHTRLWWKNLTERDHFAELGVDVRITLKHIFTK
jgi:hypothetical protein